MPAPQVSWYTRDNTTQMTAWDLQTIDAGTISNPTGVLIWNNRGGGSAISDMTSCTITTKDNGGGNLGELIIRTWIEVKVDSLAEANFNPIGGDIKRDIRCAGIGTPAAKTIYGGANDGTYAGAKNNFAEISLRANVPTDATAGLVNFLTRVSYQYV